MFPTTYKKINYEWGTNLRRGLKVVVYDSVGEVIKTGTCGQVLYKLNHTTPPAVAIPDVIYIFINSETFVLDLFNMDFFDGDKLIHSWRN